MVERTELGSEEEVLPGKFTEIAELAKDTYDVLKNHITSSTGKQTESHTPDGLPQELLERFGISELEELTKTQKPEREIVFLPGGWTQETAVHRKGSRTGVTIMFANKNNQGASALVELVRSSNGDEAVRMFAKDMRSENPSSRVLDGTYYGVSIVFKRSLAPKEGFLSLPYEVSAFVRDTYNGTDLQAKGSFGYKKSPTVTVTRGR